MSSFQFTKGILIMSKGEDDFYDKRGEGHVVLRLVAVKCAISSVSPLTVALIGGRSVDACGKGVTVVESQPAFLNIRAGRVGPNRIFLLIIQVLQLHLHFQGSRGGRCLGLRAGRVGQRWILNRYAISIYLPIHLAMAQCRKSFSLFERKGILYKKFIQYKIFKNARNQPRKGNRKNFNYLFFRLR